jgi:hypothetical protein
MRVYQVFRLIAKQVGQFLKKNNDDDDQADGAFYFRIVIKKKKEPKNIFSP